MFERFKKGKTALDAGIPVATNWEEFQPDTYNGSEDGDDTVHHKRLAPYVHRDLVMKHRQESDV